MTKKYTVEAEFEKEVVAKLNACGWKGGSNYPFVLKYPSEADLIKNWANIIFEHNRKELNNVPLNQDEIDNLLLKIRGKTPCEINRIINSKLIDLIRSNKADTENYNKTVYLEIYDRRKIQDGETVSLLSLDKNQKLLDIGYGNGYLLKLADKSFGCNLYGIDISEDMKNKGVLDFHHFLIN